MAKVETKSVYDEKFFECAHDGAMNSARAIAPIVVDLLSPRSVVDIGCGIGQWLLAFRENGVQQIRGLDGGYVKRETLLIPESCYEAVDLEHHFYIPGSFDLALCLEVGEHLNKSAAAGLVKSITQSAPFVLFSAACPRQGGTHHVNEQWPDYWKRLFAKHGYVRLDPVRWRIAQNRDVCWWYRQNLFLFARESAIQDRPDLRELLANDESQDMVLLSAAVFEQLTNPRRSKNFVRHVLREFRTSYERRFGKLPKWMYGARSRMLP